MKKTLNHILLIFFMQFCAIYSQTTADTFTVISVPKCGTHLLTKALEMFLDKKAQTMSGGWKPDYDFPKEKLEKTLTRCVTRNKFAYSHILPADYLINTLKKLKHKVIFIIRDPRDQVVSLFYWIRSGRLPFRPQLSKQYATLNDDELMDEIITGERFGVSCIKSFFGDRLPWLEQSSDFVYSTRFEKLVGSQGGGSDQVREDEFRKILKFINADIDDNVFYASLDLLFGDSFSFRSGKIGSWKTHFNEAHIEAFKLHFGKELIELGYEKDHNWPSESL